MVIVSDVDGTLLADDETCPFAPEWLASVAGQHQVILASSRTINELMAVQRHLGWTGPLIAEDGQVVVTAAGDQLMLGSPVAELRRRIKASAVAVQVESLLQAHVLSDKDRHASLLLPAAAADPSLVAELSAVGLEVARGGRWATITAGGGKGAAARHLLTPLGVSSWAAIGNAPNDVTLLAAAPLAFVVRNVDGHEPTLMALPHAVPLEQPGPLGWHEMLERLASARTAPSATTRGAA